MEQNPRKLKDFKISGGLAEQAKAREAKIVVAATFTAEPLEETLTFWMKRWQIAAKIEFAAYNQVIQQLLDTVSLLAGNVGGANVLLARANDWGEGRAEGERNVRELAAAIRQAKQRSATPCLVCIAPAFRSERERSGGLLDELEALLASELRDTPGVCVVGSTQLLDLYPVRDYEDPHALSIAAIPYTPAFFTALASLIARWMHGLRAAPAKVIVLACDGTLWNEGPLGVVVGDARRELQEFMVTQQEAGRLLCLAGKDREENVHEVFRSNPEMRLGLDHFTAERFDSDGKPSSELLRELADELGMGLEGFVYVGSNPMECVELRAACPEVTVAELPSKEGEIAGYLRHFWGFDQWNIKLESGKQKRLPQNNLLAEIALELGTVDKIIQSVESERVLRHEPGSGRVKPRNATEEILSGIWAGLLKLEQPGIHDNFFKLGGNSLLGAQVISRVRQALGIEMPLRAMFEAPTIAGFVELIESTRRKQSGMIAPPLLRKQCNGPMPASFAQQRLWFADQLEPGNPIYNIPQMVRLRGALNVEALEKALNAVVQRHEALRTTFDTMDGQPVQVIAGSLWSPLPVIDLSAMEQEAGDVEAERLAHVEAVRPFDLARGPVLRASLLRRAANDHVLLLILHHIAGDRWSAGILAEEIEALYGAYVEGKPSPLKDLPVQYADYAVWQREWLQGEVLERQVSYWKRQLAGAPAMLEMPTDRPRPAVQSHRGANERLLLGHEIVEKLTALGHAHGATVFMTLLATLQILLARYSRQEDIVVGSPIAGRNYAEVEPLIGFFVNTLALRTDLSENPSFLELLARVKETTLNAYAHQDIPFERLVEELQPERSLSYNPVFQVAFALQNAPLHSLELAGLVLERIPLHQGTSAFDMSWFAAHMSDGMLLRVEYNADLFEGETIRRILGHFENLIGSIVAHPERRLSDLEMMGEAERRKVLVEWNDTARAYPQTSVLELFEAQAEKDGGAVAIRCGGQQVTYHELNQRANQLARWLKRQGIGPEVLVALLTGRSIETIVGILAVIKAGGAYLPVDPAYPQERIDFILRDSRAQVALTLKASAALQFAAARALCLDGEWKDFAASESEENLGDAVEPESLAYVIYTSGSTGQPKGVEICHRSLTNLVRWHQRAYQVTAADRATQIAGPAFDASVWELWPYLAAGASISIPDEQARATPSALVQWFADQEITITFLPTPLAEECFEERWPTHTRLRALLTGGDKLKRLPQSETPFALFNNYGPTENTVVTTWMEVPFTGGGNTAPAIGRPIDNVQVYLLDKRLQPVAAGVAGELCIGGEGLARGYLNRPELAAEKFIADPFSGTGGARLYKTGDLCRWLADGTVEYLGRMDDQVKLRGFRIELGEIEAALRAHGSVRDCVAIIREDKPGDKRLVAYMVASPGLRSAEVRDYLKQKLPEYMVPSVLVMLDRLPLSPNGKVDRKQLPKPEHQSIAPSERVLTPTEEIIAGIWSEVLNIPRAEAEDNFFELGGHSLLATQVVSRIRRGFGIDLPLRAMFESPTLAALAKRIDNAKRGFALPAIARAPRERPLPLSFAQQRLWFLDQLEPDNPLYNVPLAIRMSGNLRAHALEAAFNEIARRHDVLRTTFAVEDNGAVQNISPEIALEIEHLDLSGLTAADQELAVKRVSEQEARRPFDLRNGPLFRASLLRLAAEDHILLLNMHHIVSDGWSLWRFVVELTALYGAFIEGRPSPHPELKLQYADFAVWQREWMRSGALEEQLAYWKKQLEGALSTLDLPTDRPRPSFPSYRGKTESVVLPASLRDKLNVLSRGEGTTLFMTLLAAYKTLLFRYSGQEDISAGTAIANRNHSEIEDLLGFFVNTLVMRTDLSGNPSFRELLHRVREFALGAFANQDLPFEKLVEVLQPQREMGQTPLFQVWFAMQNAPSINFHLPGLDLHSMETHSGTSKFDLALFCAETTDGLWCKVEYSSELFDSATIRRFLDHYRVLLESICDNADQSIAALPLLTGREYQQIVLDWNRRERPAAAEQCIHHLFEEQAAAAPESIAVVFEERQLTYRELNQRANQLAHRLRGLDVGPETLVGICLERSLEMLVAILGVLKAGGAYVPVDPGYPRERQAFMLEDAGAPVLVTDSKLAAELPPHGAVEICLDRDWAAMAGESAENPPRLANPDNLAYIIYTSGSTGKPKGAMITHANVSRLFTATEQWFSFGPGDAWTLFHSFAFDFSVWEIWGALLYGGRLIVVPRALARSPEGFHELLVRHQVTVLNQTPSAFRALIEADARSSHSGSLALRVVIFGGEALDFKSLLPWYERHPRSPRLINMYGITETTVHVTYLELSASVAEAANGSLIGTRIPDLQTYILNTEMQPVPVGVAGELFVGGEGLARGYLNRPELTTERFIPNPFSQETGARLYKTGDLARYLPAGDIEYLGRIDQQVKIRGFRIELGEIENTIETHPGVRQCVVMAREDEPGEKRLVAYLVAAPEYRDPEQSVGGDVSAQQVSQWAQTFDEAYRQKGNAKDATFNITGWDSSYTGEPIAAGEMRVWVESTVGRILALRPKRVWEIGCGTGLLMFRVAPHCEHYYGTDISQTSLNFLQQQLQRPELKMPQVKLARKAAHEFDLSGEDGKFDAITLNSVIQYFPDLNYLMEVLEGAVKSLAPGGSVFVGDVRSLPLLELFHTSVQMYLAPDSLPLDQLRLRARNNIRGEGELLIDPEFFHALRRRIPEINRVEIQLKRGYAHNELTRFRYDVVLHKDIAQAPVADCTWLDWRGQKLDTRRLRELLEREKPEVLGVCNVPNGRLQAEIAALEIIAQGSARTVGEVRARMKDSPQQTAVEPEDLWAIEAELPYEVVIRASRDEAMSGCFDLLLRRKSPAAVALPRFPAEPEEARATAKSWESYANNPLRERIAGNLVPQVRRFLGEKLPEYMVPAAFVVLDSIPLTANGKANRKALPQPDQLRPQGQPDYAAPRTPTEELLSAIWADVLHLEQIGTGDNFFELGGHSLSATQVIARARQTFHLELPLRILFESPTVAALAEHIERLQRNQMGTIAPPITPAPRGGAFPLSFAQQRLWFLQQLEPSLGLYNVPRTIRMKGTLDVQALEYALNGVVARHEIARTSYGLENDQPVQVIAEAVTVELPVVDLSAAPASEREQEARRVLQAEADKPFDLTKPTVLRLLLARLDLHDHILLLNTHHIATDGWSGGVLLRDLMALYAERLEGRPAQLPELPIQYADYALWQRNWLQGETLEKQLAYWKAQLDGAPPVLLLPHDRERPPAQTFRGALVNTLLPRPLAEQIRGLSRRQGSTPFMTLLAVFDSLLSYKTGQTDIVLGTDVANRTSVQTEGLLGFFVNLLVLRADLSGDPSFTGLLRRVREAALGAYAHQDVAFDKLVEELQPERSMTHNPLVQALFVQQNAPKNTLTMPGLELGPFPLGVSSKFDMAVFVSDTDGGIACMWLYNPDLFDVATITRMAALYQTALEHVVANPEVKLSEMKEQMAEAERQYRALEHTQFEAASLQKLKKIKRKAIGTA